MTEDLSLPQARVRRPKLLLFHATATADVRADGRGLTLGGRLLDRAAIERAEVLPSPGGVWVRMRVRGEGGFDVSVRDVPEGRRFLAALQLDAAQRTVRYKVPSTAIKGGCFAMLAPLFALIASLGVAIVLAPMLHSGAPFAFPLIVLVAVFAFLLSPATLTIDGAGASFTWMGRTRRLPRETLQGAEVYDNVVTTPYRDKDGATVYRKTRQVGVRILGADPVDIPMYTGTDDARELAELIAERIREVASSRV